MPANAAGFSARSVRSISDTVPSGVLGSTRTQPLSGGYRWLTGPPAENRSSRRVRSRSISSCTGSVATGTDNTSGRYAGRRAIRLTPCSVSSSVSGTPCAERSPH